MTSDSATASGERSKAAGASRAAAPAMVAGFLFLLVGAWWIGFGNAQLGTVLLTQVGVVSQTLAPSPSWAVLTGLTGGGLLLLTSPRVWVGAVDWAKLLGAGWALGWTLLLSFFSSAFEFTGPQARCVYSSCWPRGYQELAIASPLLTACLVMVVMATAGRRLAWWWRAATPAVTFVALTVLQVQVWDRLAVPFLSGPPPF